MATIDNIQTGLAILLRYGNGTVYVEPGTIVAKHNEPAEVPVKDKNILKRLGWLYDAESECWYRPYVGTLPPEEGGPPA